MTSKDLAEHHNAWDQIPWLINGTLTFAEADAVNLHVSSCQECAAEMARQQRLAETVTALTPPMPSQAYALEEISSRLTTQKPAVGVLGQILKALSRIGGASAQSLLIGGAVAAVMLMFILANQPSEPQFETLTSPGIPANGVEIRLRFQSNADIHEIKNLLADNGVSDIVGPTDTGLISGTVAKESIETVIGHLKSDPRIIFIARDR